MQKSILGALEPKQENLRNYSHLHLYWLSRSRSRLLRLRLSTAAVTAAASVKADLMTAGTVVPFTAAELFIIRVNIRAALAVTITRAAKLTSAEQLLVHRRLSKAT